MASAIRDLSYLFIYSRRLEIFGFVARLAIALFFIILSLHALAGSLEAIAKRLLVIIALEIMVLSYFRGFKATIGAIRLVLLFVLLGSGVYALSVLLGYAPLSLFNILFGSLQLVSIFTAFSLLFQLVSLREWRSIYGMIGLGEYAVLFSMVMAQLPLVIYYASEAFTTTRLKYGGKRLYKFVIPLTLLALYTSRNLVESYLLYGAPLKSKISLFKPRDFYLYILLAGLIVFFMKS